MIAIDPSFVPIPHIRRAPKVKVALVNNTSDRALAATEAQFLALLGAATAGTELEVKFFTASAIPRAEPPRTRSGALYDDLSNLFATNVDALVVTGMEPAALELRDEPVWPALAKLIDWVDHRRIPSLWSCLAAHAAVLRLDGITRRPHATKVSDILCCTAVADMHPLVDGLPQQWWTPHSRYYGLPECDLVASGYQVLSRAATGGVDMFTKEGNAPFLFFQGHPEYEPDSLLNEYKRDVRRYFSGKRDVFPVAPASYFTQETAFRLAQLRQQAMEEPARARADSNMLEQILALAKRGVAPVQWNNVAARVCANWMASVGGGATNVAPFAAPSERGIPASPVAVSAAIFVG